MNTDLRFHGMTYLKTSMPWGFYLSRGHRVLFPDGRIRAVRVSDTPDTFFSLPANTTLRIEGRRVSVTGYVTVEEDSHGRAAWAFRPYTRTDNILPEWPGKFTPEHNQLIARAFAPFIHHPYNQKTLPPTSSKNEACHHHP